jgi:two-component system, chemotaxis family, CheB/CheR fusion protein
VQQLLYGVQWRIYTIQGAMPAENPEGMKEQIITARQLIDQAVHAARALTVELSPLVLKNEGLPEAIKWLAHQMQQVHALNVAVEVYGACRVTNVALRVLLFQMVRELLFNVVKHAHINHASVTVRQEDDQLKISVVDEGQGFEVDRLTSTESVQTGFGLTSIQERLRLFGGQIEINSTPGSGTSALHQLISALPSH